MSTPEKGSAFLEEFKNFVAFLQNLWGILAGISVLFPLSNHLAQVIPLGLWPEGGLAYISPQVITTVATITALFLILWTFSQRQKTYAGKKREQIRRQAQISFGVGVATLIVYLVTQYAIRENFYYGVLGWDSGDARRLLGDVILLLAYAAFFTLITRAFVLLGMMEYFGRKS